MSLPKPLIGEMPFSENTNESKGRADGSRKNGFELHAKCTTHSRMHSSRSTSGPASQHVLTPPAIDLDPFTVELILDGLYAAAQEMFVTLRRTAKSPIIYEVLDYACGIYSSDGALIAQDNGRFRRGWGPPHDPTLAEVLARIPPGCGVLLDPKEKHPRRRARLCAAVCRELAGRGDLDRFAVSTDRLDDLAEYRRAGLRTWRTLKSGADLARATGLRLHP